jgi:hypothetical protein
MAIVDPPAGVGLNAFREIGPPRERVTPLNKRSPITSGLKDKTLLRTKAEICISISSICFCSDSKPNWFASC